MKDFFEVYLADNLERKILHLFRTNQTTTSHMWESFVQSLDNDNKRKNIANQLKIELPATIDSKVAAKVISQAILQKSKIIKSLKKNINQELKKYMQSNGEELNVRNMKLRAYISKNKASFFAKASAGLCTSKDTESFKREDHFHINIIDDLKQECVWNLMAYDIQHNNERILLLRWFNPNTSLLKEIDIPSYCEAVIKVAEQFAMDNDFAGVYMTETLNSRHALSNRNEIVAYLGKKYWNKQNEEECEFYITRDVSISHIHPITKFEKEMEMAI